MPRRAVIVFAAIVLALAAVLGATAFLTRDAGTLGSGTALVGGPFTLTDQDGRRVTERDFLGRHMLVFFGFTYCPDICPTELQVMTAAIDALGEDAAKITPVFVTVDPERDTPQVMKAYAGNFSPRLVGLTGTPEEIARMARSYRVYYTKAGKPGASDYLMDHTSIVYLMGPDGRYLKHFTYTTDAPRLAKELKEAITASR